MDPKNIVLVGVNGTVIAFQKINGSRLWSTKLKSGLSVDFVSVAADDTRVYAHTGGELFCLDIHTGRALWEDKLSGLGFGVASLALPGLPSATLPAVFEKKRHDDAAGASAASSGSH